MSSRAAHCQNVMVVFRAVLFLAWWSLAEARVAKGPVAAQCFGSVPAICQILCIIVWNYWFDIYIENPGTLKLYICLHLKICNLKPMHYLINWWFSIQNCWRLDRMECWLVCMKLIGELSGLHLLVILCVLHCMWYCILCSG